MTSSQWTCTFISMTVQATRYLTAPQVAEQLNIHERTVHKYLKQGKLTGAKVGGRWLITRDSVDTIVERLAEATP